MVQLGNNVKISVIIPVYNTEKYISRTIESIISQTYQDWELILVDDGSQDASSAICDKYANSRIKVFHKSNGGVSSARNHGISHSKGEYIAFVDSDDYVDKQYLENLIAGDGCDLSVSGYCYGTHTANIPPFQEGKYDFKGIREHINTFLNTDHFCFPWARLYKRKLINENNIRFNENMRFAEDHVFNWTFLSFVKSLYIDRHTCYHKNTEQISSYHLSFNDVDYIDGILYKLLSKMSQSFQVEIKPQNKDLCHLSFLENNLHSNKMSEYISYFAKYHPKASEKEMYSYIAEYIYYPALQTIKNRMAQGKNDSIKDDIDSLDLFLDKPWPFIKNTNIKSRFLVPLIKMKTYKIIWNLLQ